MVISKNLSLQDNLVEYFVMTLDLYITVVVKDDS